MCIRFPLLSQQGSGNADRQRQAYRVSLVLRDHKWWRQDRLQYLKGYSSAKRALSARLTSLARLGYGWKNEGDGECIVGARTCTTDSGPFRPGGSESTSW